MKALKHFFKLRYFAKRYNIWTQQLDPKCKEGYWLCYDGNLYYGHPLFVFFYSCQNNWFNSKKH